LRLRLLLPLSKTQGMRGIVVWLRAHEWLAHESWMALGSWMAHGSSVTSAGVLQLRYRNPLNKTGAKYKFDRKVNSLISYLVARPGSDWLDHLSTH
jgi:hypothetical protein